MLGIADDPVSIKQVEVTPSGVLLWPRSSNPRYQDPLSLTEGIADEEQIEVRIRAKLLTVTRRF